jgi:hypothetical protein
VESPSAQKKKTTRNDRGVDLRTMNETGRAIIVILLSFIGATTVFSSWIAQNYFKDKWASERQFLEKTQFLVEIVQGTAGMWQLQVNLEAKRVPIDNDLYKSALFNYIRAVATLTGWEAQRIADNTDAITEKDKTISAAEDYFNKSDVQSLLTMMHDVNAHRKTMEPLFDDKYAQSIQESGENAEFWNGAFLVLYSVGTIMFGIGWILKHVFGWPDSLQKIYG